MLNSIGNVNFTGNVHLEGVSKASRHLFEQVSIPDNADVFVSQAPDGSNRFAAIVKIGQRFIDQCFGFLNSEADAKAFFSNLRIN